GSNSGGGLKTYCFFLNLLLSNRRHLRVSTLSALATGHLGSKIVADVQRTAEKFRRHMISLCDELVALFAQWNNSDCIRFYFDFQACLIGNVTEGFTKWNIVQRHGDARPGWPADRRHDGHCARAAGGGFARASWRSLRWGAGPGSTGACGERDWD